jgi:SAM-dependent methyltransferase
MKDSLNDILRCPLTMKKMTLEVYEREDRKYGETTVSEIISGLLISPSGYLFPIIKGVPRIQLESFLEHEQFLRKNRNDYDEIKKKITDEYDYVIKQAIKRNKKTKQSFGMEWNTFRYESDATWGFTKESRKERVLEELQTTPEELQGKTMFDVGCGNGVLTSGVSEFGVETYGLDVSNSIENAFKYNVNPKVHFIQGDLQLPPFAAETFDIVYSTGVLIVTNNTELSFSCLCDLTKRGGKYYVWLYKPEKDLKHKSLNVARAFTNKFPIKVQYWMFLIFLVPQGLLKMRLRGVKRNWREQLINYFDVLSCEYRFEHTPKEVELWYIKRDFKKPIVTIIEYLGFGIYGIRN